MRVLFDQGTPVPLRQALQEQHEVSTAYELGWSTLTNGELIERAERAGYDVLVTTDSNLRHHQNLANFRLAFVVLVTTSWPRIQRATESILVAVNAARSGSYIEIEIPL